MGAMTIQTAPVSSDSDASDNKILATGARVLRTEGEALLQFANALTGDFARAVEAMHACNGRIIMSGMG